METAPRNVVMCCDVLEGLRQIPSGSVQCCVTSPPYWGLRDYGVDGQIGLEATMQEFVARMVDVFAEVRRVPKPDGVCWVNIDDSRTGNGSQYGDRASTLQGRKESGTAAAAVRFKKGLCGLKAKDLPGIPWRVAFALQDDGWWLRQDIIWHKPNPKPESVTDRCTATHEYIFMLTKSARYYYDQDAIREPSVSAQPKHEVAGWASGPGSHASIDHAKVKVASAAAFGGPNGAMRRKYVPGCSQPTTRPAKGVAEVCSTRNCRSVWTIASQPCKESHFATFPEELPRRCIMASTREGDMVLDPFAGSGTTLMVAKELGRNYIGIELNPEYAAMAERRVASVTGSLFAQK